MYDITIGCWHILTEANYLTMMDCLDFIRKEKPDRLVLCGDTWDPLCGEKKHLYTAGVCQDVHLGLLDIAKEIETVFVYGNHDPMKLMIREDRANIDFQIDTGKIVHAGESYKSGDWLFMHGHQLNPADFIWDIAQNPIARWLLKRSPWFKHFYCESPHQEKAVNEQVYNVWVLAYHTLVCKKAMDKGFNIVVAHSHSPAVFEGPRGLKYVDVGDMKDSCTCACIKDGKPEIKYFEKR